jgi:hypothetical protein
MCMACEEADMYYRWQLLQQIAKGEMPAGLTEDDLRAMELPLPSEVELIEEADGTMVLKRKEPVVVAPKPAAANAFVCDTPDGE